MPVILSVKTNNTFQDVAVFETSNQAQQYLLEQFGDGTPYRLKKISWNQMQRLVRKNLKGEINRVKAQKRIAPVNRALDKTSRAVSRGAKSAKKALSPGYGKRYYVRGGTVYPYKTKRRRNYSQNQSKRYVIRGNKAYPVYDNRNYQYNYKSKKKRRYKNDEDEEKTMEDFFNPFG